MKYLLSIFFTFISILSFSQKGENIDNYTKAEIKQQLEKMKAEYPDMLKYMEAQKIIDEEGNTPKNYTKQEEKVADRYSEAENCKLILLSKENDSVSFYGKTVKLINIDKNKATLLLPESVANKIQEVQAESINGNLVNHFFKNFIRVIPEERFEAFKSLANCAFNILDNFDNYSEKEIKDKLKKEEEKIKALPPIHKNRKTKTVVYFHGNVKEVILYIKE